jgi:hypothetical protein
MNLFRVSRRRRGSTSPDLEVLAAAPSPEFVPIILLLLGLLIFLKSQDFDFFFDSSAHLFGGVPTDPVVRPYFPAAVDSLAGGAEFLLRTSNISPR